MERRNFIKNTSSVIIGSTIAPAVLSSAMDQDLNFNKKPDNKLKGFIVSDAHFGWMNEYQPAPEFQKEMMNRIMKRFPDLDVFFDTGDAHHNDHHENSDPYLARKNWCDIIQGGCGQVPFYYIVGNHEIYSNEDEDPEMRSNIMGSTSCRPYYSFDMKGIHFISFPELMKTIYITDEEFKWLDLDLELNKNRTTVLLSHNNIIGTTSGNEPGYRGLMDSEKMLGIFKRNPYVISWMHGHNHNFEIIESQNMLFVSNGRIGGFDPSLGKHGIGGIYFEISGSGLLVKCYSAEKDMFLENISGSLTQELKVTTTLDSMAKGSYNFGVGGAINRERFPVYNHHSGNFQKREIYVAGCRDAIINEDPLFTRYTERHAWHGLDKILLAAKINHGNSVFEYTNPGIRLKANSDWFTTVTMPGENFSLYSYFRCPVDTEYKISIDLETFPVANAGKQVLWLRLLVHDIEGKILRIIQSEGITLRPGNQKLEEILKVPPIGEYETIYSDPESDKLVNMAVEASFSGMESGDVTIKSIKLSMDNAEGVTINPGLIINGEKCSYNGSISENQIIKLPLNPELNARDVIEVASEGIKRLTFHIKHTDLEWQVRNATVKDFGKYLEIKKIRNKLSDKMEIIIVPLFKVPDPYIHRVRNAEGLRIYPLSRENKILKIEIDKISENTQVEVFSSKQPVKINNVLNWGYDNNIVLADIVKPGPVHFHF